MVDQDKPDDQSSTDPRAKLIAAAGPVFAQHGFKRSTLREICSIAEVNVAAVSYYFGDKMGLYTAVINKVRDDRDRKYPPPEKTEMDEPKIALWRIVRTILSRMLDSEEANWETHLLMREMNNPTPAFAELVDDFFRPLFAGLTDAIERMIERPVETQIVEQLALSAVGQCLHYKVGRGVIDILIPAERREQHFDIDTLSQHVTAVIIAAADQARIEQEKTALVELIQEHSTPTPTSGNAVESDPKDTA